MNSIKRRWTQSWHGIFLIITWVTLLFQTHIWTTMGSCSHIVSSNEMIRLSSIQMSLDMKPHLRNRGLPRNPKKVHSLRFWTYEGPPRSSNAFLIASFYYLERRRHSPVKIDSKSMGQMSSCLDPRQGLLISDLKLYRIWLSLPSGGIRIFPTRLSPALWQ